MTETEWETLSCAYADEVLGLVTQHSQNRATPCKCSSTFYQQVTGVSKSGHRVYEQEVNELFLATVI
jgi:hypothetical protein